VRVRVVGRQSMVKVKTGREYAKRYALKCLMAYLDREQNLNWIVGAIRWSLKQSLTLSDLSQLFDRLQDYGDAHRYREAKAACEERGWI